MAINMRISKEAEIFIISHEPTPSRALIVLGRGLEWLSDSCSEAK
jgi:hypothetical protein